MKRVALSMLFLALAPAACGGAQQSAPAAPAEAAAPAAPAAEASAPAAPAARPATTKLGPNNTADGVVFNFKLEPKPKKIFLAGSFNAWNPADPAFVMKDDDGDGIFSITVKLEPGTYQYKYVADGSWIQDAEAPMSAPDGYGGYNSKFIVVK